MPTPDRTPGPSLEEETQYEDRGPGGDNDGDPTVTGGLRRVTDSLRYKASGQVEQVLKARNYPAGFDDVDLTGILDGDPLTYEASSKTFKPGGITVGNHRTLRHLIHFIDDGPAGGFPSGAYKEILPAADPFPTSAIWWSSAAKVNKIVELTVTRNANKTPATEVWKMYDAAGLLLATVTDTISYTGVIETSRTRAIV